MSKKNSYVFFCGALIIGLVNNLSAEEKGFLDIQNEFEQHKTKYEKEFSNYKEIIESEFSSYKNEIKKHWDNSNIDNAAQWVRYSNDKKTRTIVDYEAGEIRVQTQDDDSARAAVTILSEVERAISIDMEEAFANDELSQRINKKIKDFKNIESAPVEKKPILSDIYFDKKPTADDVKRKSIALIKSAKTIQSNTPVRNVQYTEVVIPLPKTKKGANKLPAYMQTKANNLIPYAKNFSAQEQIRVELIMAVIQSESSFNPMARSGIPAFGLMQIVPKSAGLDVTKYKMGRARILSPSYLYNAKNNIEVGAAYLNILYYRYLKDITDPKSRLYCAIAAYNTGAGNVARTFTGSLNIKHATTKINRLTPNEVYQHLIENLPFNETRRYLKKVTSRMPLYEDI